MLYSTGAEGLYDSWSYGLLKDVYFEKLEKGEKFPQLYLGSFEPAPSNLCSNA